MTRLSYDLSHTKRYNKLLTKGKESATLLINGIALGANSR